MSIRSAGIETSSFRGRSTSHATRRRVWRTGDLSYARTVKITRVPRAVALVLGLGMLVSCGSTATDTAPSPSASPSPSAVPGHDLVTGARDQTLPAHCGGDFLAYLTGRQKLAQLLNV